MNSPTTAFRLSKLYPAPPTKPQPVPTTRAVGLTGTLTTMARLLLTLRSSPQSSCAWRGRSGVKRDGQDDNVPDLQIAVVHFFPPIGISFLTPQERTERTAMW